MSESTNKKKIKVLSLNHYIMGHATYQNILERTFREHIPEVEFNSLHLTDHFSTDFLGKLVYWLFSKRLPGLGKKDYDFARCRTELADSFFGRRCLVKALKNYRPDIIHIHTQSIAYLSSSIFKKIPAVVSIDYTAALLAKEHPRPANVTYQPIIYFEKKCFEAAAHVITWSKRARDSVIEHYGISPQKVTVIAPPVCLEEFASLTPKKLFNKDRPRLLFVGNDFERKGGEDLLAVFLESLSHLCELDIVSNASIKLPTMPNLRLHQGISRLSPEILQLYAESDIFVMPTREDVYGIVFSEAMAAGLPCIGTKVMAVPELVQNGVNGFTISPGDREALRKALLELINNYQLRLAMGLASKKLAQKQFDAISNCKEILRIFTHTVC